MSITQRGNNEPNLNRSDPDQNDLTDNRPGPDVYQGNANTATQNFIDVICADKKQAEGNQTTDWENYKTSRVATNHQICLLNKAEATATIYRQIDNCVATMASQATVEIQANVSALATAETGKGDVLKNQLKEAINALKEVNKKMGDMERSAELLKSTFEDASQTESRQALLKAFPRIGEEFNEVDSQVYNCNTRIDATLNDAFTTAGIQTFLNLAELTDFAARLSVAVVNFKEDVTFNNKQAADHTTEAQTNLTEALKKQVSNKVTLFNTRVSLDSLEHIREFVCNPRRLEDFTISCKMPTPPQSASKETDESDTSTSTEP